MKIFTYSVGLMALLLTSLVPAGEREAKAWMLMDKGALVIDVRSTEEYAQAHLDDALHIPYQRITQQFQKLEIRPDRAIVLYCRSGRRADIAKAALERAGYQQVFNGGGLEPLTSQRGIQP